MYERIASNVRKTWGLIFVFIVLVMAIGWLVGEFTGFGLWGLAGATVFAVLMTWGSYFASDKIALSMSKAQPADEIQHQQLHNIVDGLSLAAGIPKPRVYVVQDDAPNAFATGRNPEHAAVAVTQGILETLDWDELRGVLAHEMSHVGNRDILIGSVAAAVAMGITFIATMLRFAAIFGGGRDDRGGSPFELLALAILAPLAAGLLQMALSRSREFEADRTGARIIGNGEPLARALLKLEAGAKQIPMNIDPAHAQAFIVNPLSGRKVQFANLFRTHPPVEERVDRLRSGEWR
jgi:heat shock protein HtpX